MPYLASYLKMMSYHTDHPNAERPMEIELIRSMARGTITPARAEKLGRAIEARKPVNTDDAFISMPAAQWLHLPEGERTTDMLFGEFWYKGELAILFADTNVGKSVLAVQIGDAINKGATIDGLSIAHESSPVLYFDFELSANQFVKRYSSDALGHYKFADNFHRLVMNPDAGRERKFASYHDYIINAMENVLVSTGSRTVIIDNITCLRTGTNTAAGAVLLMRSLNNLKNRYKLSLLVLAHTPKRNPARAISRNDLQGSKMLLNFADSAFSIGESHTKPGISYLKQIKQRSGEPVYGADHVLLCRLTKPVNFLKFQLLGYGVETHHLRSHTQQQQKATEDRVMKMHAEGCAIRQIATEVGLSNSAVHRMVARLSKVDLA